MSVSIEPILSAPLRDQVYGRLQDLLIGRAFSPGDHLVEEALAQRLSVSRGPVREALQRLHRDGWVTLRPRHGAFVNHPTPQQVDEFFEARELVEAAAAALAAERATPEDVRALLQVCDDAQADLERGAPPTQMAAHTSRFHLLVLETGQNHLLVQFGEQLSARSRWFFAPLVAGMATKAWDEHREIATLVAENRAEGAAKAMRAHIASSRLAYLANEEDEVSTDDDAAVPPQGGSR